MLILFDHGTPKGLARALSGHTVHTAQAKGWDALSNGELLSAAEEAGFELLLTTDRRIRHQQNLQVRRVALVVLTGTTKWSLVRQHRAHRCHCGFGDAWQLRRGRDSLRAEVTELVRLTCAVYHATGPKLLKMRPRSLVLPRYSRLRPCATHHDALAVDDSRASCSTNRLTARGLRRMWKSALAA